MSTSVDFNEEELQADYAERNFSPFDGESIERIYNYLVQLGLEPERTEFGTVRATLTTFGQPYAVAHFVSAKEVFYSDEYIDNRCAKYKENFSQVLLQRFQSKQRFWTQENTRDGLDKYIFVVDCHGVINGPEYQVFRYMLEGDFFAARKVVSSLVDLRKALTSPFSPVAHRANVTPAVYCARASADYYSPEPPPDFTSTVTHLFRPEAYPQLCARLAERANRRAILELANTLFIRIMGSDYSLVEEETELLVARTGQTRAIAFSWLGRGEQAVVTLCVFLGLAHDAVTPGMCIGIRESLNLIDESRHYNACECLRHFILATSASVYIQTDNKDRQGIARRKLEKAVELLKHANDSIIK